MSPAVNSDCGDAGVRTRGSRARRAAHRLETGPQPRAPARNNPEREQDEEREQEEANVVRAARKGLRATVRALVDAGPALASGEALRAAARAGKADTVALLCCASPASVDARDDRGLSALHLAAAARSPRAVKTLLRVSGPDARDGGGRTPLHFVALQSPRRRRAAGARPPGRGGYAGRTIAVLHLLVAAMADLDAADVNGLTPLHMAVLSGNLPVAQELVRMGAATRPEWRRCSAHRGLTSAAA